MTEALTVRALTPELWPALERLFGAKGACGGCWCQSWRIAKGERWEDVKGAEAKRRTRAAVRAGTFLGVLAFRGDEPVGWAALGPRRDFAKLDRAPSLACDDADRVGAVPCFFVAKEHRNRGVAALLLAHAVTELAKLPGLELAEGYPIRPAADGKPSPAAFAWTGTRSLFAKAGFSPAGSEEGGKVRVRKPLRKRRR